jgi:PAS domain S-box-containing protein
MIGHEVEYRLQCKDGSWRWFMSRARLQPATKDRRARIVGISIDINRRKHEEERLRGLMNAAPDAMLIIAASGRIQQANEQALRLFGYERQELEGLQVERLVPDELQLEHQALRKRYTAAAELRAMASGRDLKARRKDGSSFPVEIELSPFMSESGMLVTIAARDVTERKRFERQLQDAKRMAEAASVAKSEFLAGMSHEIRTPLGVVLGCAELLRVPETPEAERQRLVGAILRNGKGLLALLDDILDLSKVEAGKIELERRRFLLGPFLGDLLFQMSLRAREKGLVLRLETHGALPEVIESDELRLRQILVNLIGNAIKFTERGEIVVTAAMLDQRRLEFEIRDTGCGIPLESQTKIFQPFTQAEQYISRRYGGTGLGLHLSANLAEALGGALRLVKSEPGKGSRFAFHLDPGELSGVRFVERLDTGDRAHEPAATAAHAVPASHELDGLKVLVVEDFEDNRQVFRTVLERNGAHVDVACDGREAVAKATAEAYDVILMDLQMPVMDGDSGRKSFGKKATAGRSSP